MRTSALEILLKTDRIRRRADQSRGAGFAVPVLMEYSDELCNAPFLSSNMRGTFLQTRLSRDGIVRFAPTFCPPGKEGPLMVELFRVLSEVSEREGWSNRCKDLTEAQDVMRSLGETPRALVVPPSTLEEACGEAMPVEQAERLMMMQGYVSRTSDGLLILASDLPEGKSLLASDSVGAYVRSYDHVAVLIRKADRSLVMVG